MNLQQRLSVILVLILVVASVSACVAIPSGAPADEPAGAPTEIIAAQPAPTGAAGDQGATSPAPATGSSGVLTGTVTYVQRIALPADARINVQLVDAAQTGADAVVVAEQEFTADGRQVPLPFALPYDAAAIQSGGRYVVQAGIELGGVLRWTTPSGVAVLTGGHPVSGVELMLDQVDVTPVIPPPTGLDSRNWLLVSYGVVGQEAAVPDGIEITAGFSRTAGQVAGRAACNRYFASYTEDGAKLLISKIGSTKMMCADEQMIHEAAYLQALGTAESFKVDGDTLQILFDGGKGALNFTIQK